MSIESIVSVESTLGLIEAIESAVESVESFISSRVFRLA